MMLSMSTETRPSARIDQGCRLGLELRCPGEATDSIFSEVEAWIDGGCNRQLALAAISRQGYESMNKYRSFMDFLFCQVFPEIKPACFSFYGGKGPQLVAIITDAGIASTEVILKLGCEIALIAYKNEIDLDWGQVRSLLEAQPEWHEFCGVQLG